MYHKQKMSAEDARSFDTFSPANYQYLVAVLTCGCEPYRDVFTLPRWNAQGCRINKAEKAHRITVYISKVKKDRNGNPILDDNGNEKTHTMPRNACVFCRCQVSKRSNEPPAPGQGLRELASN